MGKELVGMEEVLAGLPEPSRLKTVTVEEAAHILGVSRGTAYLAVGKGQIPALRIGRRLRVPVAKLKEMLGERSLEAAE